MSKPDFCILKKDVQDFIFTDPRFVIKAGEKAVIDGYRGDVVRISGTKCIVDPFFPMGMTVTTFVTWDDIDLV